jgi:hypothetical protein
LLQPLHGSGQMRFALADVAAESDRDLTQSSVCR